MRMWWCFRAGVRSILHVLPCKPGSQKGATSHCRAQCLCFSPCKRHKLCSAGALPSSCSAPHPHSAALKTEKQLFNSVTLRYTSRIKQSLTKRLQIPTGNSPLCIYLCLWLLGQPVFSQTYTCQRTLEVLSGLCRDLCFHQILQGHNKWLTQDFTMLISTNRTDIDYKLINRFIVGIKFGKLCYCKVKLTQVRVNAPSHHGKLIISIFF